MPYLSQVFNDSWERTQQNNLQFIDTFYEFFIDSSDEVLQMFSNTDMAKQKRLLQTSLLYITSFKSSSVPEAILKRLKAQHKILNIQAHHYDIWMDCIIKAVSAIDPKFNEEIKKAWIETFRPGIDFMKISI